MKVNSWLDPNSLQLAPLNSLSTSKEETVCSFGGSGEHTIRADTQKLPTDIIEGDSGGASQDRGTRNKDVQKLRT